MKKVCCISCKHNKKCEDKDTIQKPRPIINIKKVENKYKSNPLYQIFGNMYLQKLSNHNI